ncbi:L-ascorbate metabolism protein UlaG (beta-lactamase superfamily) [Streptacidiphilus sp. MAP12-16]|uniref:MBL fold metallo-hydrolase n=1 Tax=Streptacidiphilus sp. MAP12-16 TaxID=3156300 RepID=UPI003518ECF7
MKMTTLGHSCVRLERDGVTVVVDPGCFSDPDALAGADAVLITHEHIDHVVPDLLRATAGDVEIWTNAAVAAQFADLGGRVHAVRHGDVFSVGAMEIHVYGEKHATIHRDFPEFDNVGFLVDGLFHPGDALTVPEEGVRTLLAPAGAPWVKLAEVVDYVRQVEPGEVFLIHDAVLSPPALDVHAQILTALAGEPHGRAVHAWSLGDSVELP